MGRKASTSILEMTDMITHAQEQYLNTSTEGGLTLGNTALPTDILLVVAIAVMLSALAASVKAICSLHPALPGESTHKSVCASLVSTIP